MSVEFFLDRSLGGKILPRLLREAGWNIVTMSEVYGVRPGERVADTRWVIEQTAAGRVLLAKDAAILSVPDERAAFEGCGAVLFVFPTASMTAQAQFERLEQHREAIMTRASGSGPLAFALHPNRVSRVHP